MTVRRCGCEVLIQQLHQLLGRILLHTAEAAKASDEEVHPQRVLIHRCWRGWIHGWMTGCRGRLMWRQRSSAGGRSLSLVACSVLGAGTLSQASHKSTPTSVLTEPGCSGVPSVRPPPVAVVAAAAAAAGPGRTPAGRFLPNELDEVS
jgi:hypothetical protein